MAYAVTSLWSASEATVFLSFFLRDSGIALRWFGRDRLLGGVSGMYNVLIGHDIFYCTVYRNRAQYSQ